MSTSQLVSILIPAYNAELWIAETLQSALRQTHENIEVIVVDDGSGDDTVDVVRSFDDIRLRLIQQENQGACVARNRALAEAEGDYIQYLDADDLLAPEKIERQLLRLREEPPGTVATGPWSRFYNNDLRTATQTSAPDWKDFEPASDWLIQSWEGRGTIPTFSWLIPRAVATSAGQWSESILLNQDGVYTAQLLVAACKIAFVNDAWGYYRSGIPGSISRQREGKALRSLFQAYTVCEQTLLAHRDTRESRRAVAGLWQQFLFTAYPQVPELIKEAERRVRLYGGMYRRPSVSRPFVPVRDLLGWKPALRLQYVYRRSGIEEMVQRVKA